MREADSDTDEAWLKEKCYRAEGPYLRPFAPNVNWKKAKIFLVGLNPATPFRGEFTDYRHYWDSLTRYPKHYEDAYFAKHHEAESVRSRTGKRIAELLDYLSPQNVLVTNVYAYPSVNPLDIPKDIQQEPLTQRIICRLISICKPKILFFHGREARLFAAKYFRVKLDPNVPPAKQNVTVTISNSSIHSWLFAYHHFVGRVDTKEIMGRRLKEFAEQIHLRLDQ